MNKSSALIYPALNKTLFRRKVNGEAGHALKSRKDLPLASELGHYSGKDTEGHLTKRTQSASGAISQ